MFDFFFAVVNVFELAVGGDFRQLERGFLLFFAPSELETRVRPMVFKSPTEENWPENLMPAP